MTREEISNIFKRMLLTYNQALGSNDEWKIPGIVDIKIYVFGNSTSGTAVYIAGSGEYMVYNAENGINRIQEIIQRKYF